MDAFDDPFNEANMMSKKSPEEDNSVDQTYLGKSHELVPLETQQKVMDMVKAIDHKYTDRFFENDEDYDCVESMIDRTVEKARAKTLRTVMNKFTEVDTDGKKQPVSAEFYVSCIMQWMWIICCSKYPALFVCFWIVVLMFL